MSILQVVPKQFLLGQQVRNVFYYNSTDDSESALQALVDSIRDAWSTHLAARLSDQWSMFACDVRQVDLPGLPTVEYSFTLGTLSGGDAQDNVANQVALLVSAKAVTTKPNQARSYLAGFTEGDMADGRWIAATIADAQAWGERMLDPTEGVQADKQRLTVEWDSLNEAVLGGNVLTQVIAKNNPATQRRRRLGEGI